MKILLEMVNNKIN